MADEKVIRFTIDDLTEPIDSSSGAASASGTIEAAREVTDSLLGTFTVATQEWMTAEEADREAKEKKRKEREEKRRRKEEEEEGKGDSTILRWTKRLQKVITAIEGTNGRATKALAVFRRSLQFVETSHKKHQEAVNESTKATEDATKAATETVDNATQNANQAAASHKTLISSLWTAGKTVLALTASFIALRFISGLLTKAIENLQDVVGRFSLALEAARAETQVATIQQQIDSADRVGASLADLEETNKQLITQSIALKTEFIRLIEPFVKLVGEIVVKLLEVLTSIFGGLNDIKDMFTSLLSIVTDLVSKIPVVGRLVRPFHEWLTDQKIKDARGKPFDETIDELFSEKNLNRSTTKGFQLPTNFLP